MQNLPKIPPTPEEGAAIQLMDETILTIQEIWPEVAARFQEFAMGLIPPHPFRGLEDDEDTLSEAILAVLALELARAPHFMPAEEAEVLRTQVVKRLSKLNARFRDALTQYLSTLDPDEPEPEIPFGKRVPTRLSGLLDPLRYRYDVKTDRLAAALMKRWNRNSDLLYLMMRKWLADIPSILEQMTRRRKAG